MKRIVIACIAAVSFNVLATEAPPLELKGIRLGDTEAALLKDRASHLTCTDPKTADARRYKRLCTGSYKVCKLTWPNCEEKSQFGSAVANWILVTFKYDDTIGKIGISLKQADFAGVVDALTVKYGNPTRDTSETVHNRTGASFSNRIVQWIRPEASLTAMERSNDIDSSLVTLSGADAIAESDRNKKINAKEAAKRL
jgi:hypothetical protein